MSVPRNDLLVIVGSTGVGKSALALYLGRTFKGEIVNADSRLVYRGMDIGTAKPSLSEREEIPHHLIDILNPNEEFSLSLFLTLANESIREVQAKGKLPILVGGTGQYLWGLLEGWQIPDVPPNAEYREYLENRARQEGIQSLYRELEAIDMQSTTFIQPLNLRRIIRALEVYYLTGIPFSHARKKIPPEFRTMVLGLHCPRSELYLATDLRVEDMMRRGWLTEVRSLLSSGCSPVMSAMASVGYSELAEYLCGTLTLINAIQKIKYANHQLIRQQTRWFRLSDSRIRWLLADTSLHSRADVLVNAFFPYP